MTDKPEPTKTKKPEKGQKTPEKDLSGDKDIVLNGNYRLIAEEPLSYLDKGKIKAYRAMGNTQHGANLFALICDKSMTPRFQSKTKYMNISNPNLCKLVQSGKIFWPSEKQERYCFVYEDTIGQPIIKRDDKNPALGWKPENILSNIVDPMVTVLKEFRNKELSHGEIWPGNMFDGGSKAGQKINLGECLSSPASSNMPALYEPIERALADPMGRGPGDISSDIYALGASLAVMLRSENPMKGQTDAQIIEHKIEKGSYATLLGKERLSGAILELLRGLLYDDTAQRWTIDDIEAWQDGRRLSPKQSPKRAKATRPIMFQDKKYTRPELLAKDLFHDADQAAKLIENNEMDQWVDRAIEDKLIKSRLEQSLQDIAGYERGGSYNNRATVAVAHALYPDCCVQYKSVSFHPQGFGKYLTQSYVESKNIEPFVETIRYSFIAPIIHESNMLDKSTLLSNFELSRNYLNQKSLNAGFERCLYIMDPEAPCLSPILDKYYVQTSMDMMNAFEDICQKSLKATILFDRHVISFLSAKDRQNIDPYLSELSTNDPRKKILAQLKILATIQKRLNLDYYPAIAQWILKSFDPVLSYFHDSKKSETLKSKVEKLAKEGNLQGMAALFDSPNLYGHDVENFFQAKKHYKKLEDEKKLIEKELAKGNRYGQNTGRQVASVISMGFAFLIMGFSIYKTFLGG